MDKINSNKKIENKVNFYFSTFLFFLSFLILFPTFSIASPPIPHSFSGTIFYLNDNMVEFGSTIRVTNLNNGNIIEGITGRGPYSGSYAISIEGNEGDSIQLYASTKTNYATKTFNLSQSMYNVDLILDNEYPNTPPTIISTPSSYVELGEIFNYEIIATDNEFNIKNYTLIEFPEGMFLENNLVSWTPLEKGNETIKLRVYDIFNTYDEQVFNLKINGTTTTSTTTTSTTTTSTTTTYKDSSILSDSKQSSSGSKSSYIIKNEPLVILKPKIKPSIVKNIIIPNYVVIGYIYMFDGIHQVPRDLSFRLKNMNSGLEVEGITGEGPYPGAYSVSLTATKGDIIEFNLLNFTYKFNLEGDMKKDIVTSLTAKDINFDDMSYEDLYYSNRTDENYIYVYPNKIDNNYWPLFYVIFIFVIILTYRVYKFKKKDDFER